MGKICIRLNLYFLWVALAGFVACADEPKPAVDNTKAAATQRPLDEEDSLNQTERGQKYMQRYLDRWEGSSQRFDVARVGINYAYIALRQGTQEQKEEAIKILRHHFEGKEAYWTEGGGKMADPYYWELLPTMRLLKDEKVAQQIPDDLKHVLRKYFRDYVQANPDLVSPALSPNELDPIYESENHDIMNRSVFFLTASVLLEDAKLRSEAYAEATPREHYQAWKANLEEWLIERSQYGLTVETASPIYASVYLQAIFSLHDYAPETTTRDKAKRLLDQYFRDVSMEVLDGVRSGAAHRAYRNWRLYEPKGDSLLYYNYFLCGEPGPASRLYPLENNAPLFTEVFAGAVTPYTLPDDIKKWMLDEQARGEFQYFSTRPGQGTWKREVIKGKGHYTYYPVTNSHLLRTTMVHPEYVLGWFTVDESLPYMKISEQNQVFRLVAEHTDNSLIVIDATPSHDSRTGYNDLQGVGKKSALLIKHQVASDENARLRLFFSKDYSAQAITDSKFWLLKPKSGEGITVLVGIYGYPGQPQPTLLSEKGEQGEFLTSNQHDAILVMEVFDSSATPVLREAIESGLDGQGVWIKKDTFEYRPHSQPGVLKVYTDKRLPEIDGEPVRTMREFVYSNKFYQQKRGTLEESF